MKKAKKFCKVLVRKRNVSVLHKACSYVCQSRTQSSTRQSLSETEKKNRFIFNIAGYNASKYTWLTK